MKAVGDSNRQLVSNCGVIPGELDEFSDVFPGGTIQGVICFVVPAGELASIKLYGTAGFDTNYQYLAAS
jgi:hypothetical protein